MNYKAEIQKFITSQYLFAGVRMAFAILIPSLLLAHFGMLKEYFLFPLGVSFVGFADQVGPFVRRRNSLILAIVSFTLAAAVATLLKDYFLLILLEIIVFGLFFTLIGIYGNRLAAVGSITLVVLSIFIDGHLSGDNLVKSILIFSAGCLWYFLVFLLLSKLRPYKLASQVIGENYLELGEYLKLRAKFYAPSPEWNTLYNEVIRRQIAIKNLQEETRELVFKTRTIVSESTTQSRVLMVLFLNSIDLYEKLFTTDQDYVKIHEDFEKVGILSHVHQYLLDLSEELTRIGIALQGGLKVKLPEDLESKHEAIYEEYFRLRNEQMNAQNLEEFMSLRLVFRRLSELTEDIRIIYKVLSQDEKMAKSLSSGLDVNKFVPSEAPLKLKIFRSNLSLKSGHFRHAIRITLALLLGYLISRMEFLGIGHSYWILITILAIMRPAYSATKDRNKLRLNGTLFGALAAYLLLHLTQNPTLLLAVMFGSMILCFALLKGKYAWAVFFMTLYVFIAFNFLSPGNINGIFKDRILDTAIAGGIVFLVSYFVFPVWEHSQNLDLMKKLSQSNLEYFTVVIAMLKGKEVAEENYRLRRKDAMIDLANLSDNFQRMLSDPKKEQRKLQAVHQFVNTSHLITAYSASLAQFAKENLDTSDIDLKYWGDRIKRELDYSVQILSTDLDSLAPMEESSENPEDRIEQLLQKRKEEIKENEFFNTKDPLRVTQLTKLNTLRDTLELLLDVSTEQRKALSAFKKKN